ncbi:hypothetical protein [Sporolactobacillus pectinivorans]|uniref:hypothetical protein n=1 Tax=Sporolactobacillus pectinivorans TaxID=1591408 RepID=UPI0012FE36FA|nr:hypothetical protein [Sporolactobacillus pectinivorans]
MPYDEAYVKGFESFPIVIVLPSLGKAVKTLDYDLLLTSIRVASDHCWHHEEFSEKEKS